MDKKELLRRYAAGERNFQGINLAGVSNSIVNRTILPHGYASYG